MQKNNPRILTISMVLLVLLLACQATGAESTPAKQISIPIGGGQDTPTPGSQLSIPIGDDEADQPVVEAANVEAEPVRVVQEVRDFMSEGSSYNYGKLLVVENPNPDLAIEDTRCQLTAYDAQGTVLETEDLRIDLLLPGERRTLYLSIFLQDKPTASRLEFKITQPGKPLKTSLTSASLSSDRIKYWSMDGLVTGILKNDSDYLILTPILTAVFYDAQGKAMGVATDTSTAFIPPHGHAGASWSAPRDLQPARIEVFVVPQRLWTIKPVIGDYLVLQVSDPISISVAGPGYSGGKAFFFVTNPNTDISIGSLSTEITAYDAQGSVLGTTNYSDNLPVIFPGEKVATIGEEFRMPLGSTIATIEVQASPLVEESNLFDYHALGIDKNPLSAVDGQYQVENGPQVTCILKNSWKNPIDASTVTAVAYDSQGRVVGFGRESANNVPAGGQIDLVIPMLMKNGYNDTPSRIELFASAEQLSNIH